jgi:uncharacterized membrane protein YphA (DoxX/SURF4 family)
VQLTLRIILAGVLLWAATAKLRDPRALLAAVGEHGVLPGARRAVAGALVATEAVLGVLVLVGPTDRWAAAGAAVLGLVFVASLLRMRAAGARRARCGCFGGAHERPVGLLLARALGLAGLGALVASGAADRAGPSPEVLVGVALAVLGLAVVVLLVLVMALFRQVGVLEARVGAPSALELAGEGPPIGTPAPELLSLERRGPELVAFASPGCRLCLELEPALRALERDGLPVHSVLEDEQPAVFGDYRVPGTPFVVYLVDGVVAARGLVNTLEQVEELIAVGEERVGAPA